MVIHHKDYSTLMVENIDELGSAASLMCEVAKYPFIICSKMLKNEKMPEKIVWNDKEIQLLRWNQNSPYSDEIWKTCLPYVYADDGCIDEIIHSTSTLVFFDSLETEEKQRLLRKTTSDMVVINLVENTIIPNKGNSICTGFIQKASHTSIIGNTLSVIYKRQPVVVLFPSVKAKETNLKILRNNEKISEEKPYIFIAKTVDEYMEICHEWQLSLGYPYAAVIIEAYRLGYEREQNNFNIGKGSLCDYLSMEKCEEIGLNIHLFMYVCILAEMTTRPGYIDRFLDFNYAHLAVRMRLQAEYDAKKPIGETISLSNMADIRKAYTTWYAPMKKVLRFFQGNPEIVRECLEVLKQQGNFIEEESLDEAYEETKKIVRTAENYCCCD